MFLVILEATTLRALGAVVQAGGAVVPSSLERLCRPLT